MYAATFRRDKVCAGWFRRRVVGELGLDLDDYRRGRTLQPITGFRTGLIGGGETVETSYSRPVSFGIRRCEFDQYLLTRSGARLMLGTPVSRLRRDGRDWVVNEAVKARLLVGAGGHFCPVARWLNGASPGRPIVVAHETEFAIGACGDDAYAIANEIPELYCSADLTGYGWCFRKGNYLNVGFGRLGPHGLPEGTARFMSFPLRRQEDSCRRGRRWRATHSLFEPGRRVIQTVAAGRCCRDRLAAERRGFGRRRSA